MDASSFVRRPPAGPPVRTTLGVDLGGTNLRVGLVDTAGRILRLVATGTPDGPAAVIDAIAAAAGEIAGTPGLPPAAGCGVGAPGPLDARTGIVFETPNLRGWREVPLAGRLTEALRLPVRVLNDADAAALGEHRFGAGRGGGDLIYIGLGTGVGGGVILAGEPLVGADGIGAELGHVVVEPGGRPCGCGGRGCVEQYASASGIALTVRELLAGGARSVLAGSAVTGAEAIAIAARAGDPVARSAFATAGRYLGILLVDLAHIFNPGLVVLGGGVSTAFDLVAPPALAELHARAFRRQAARLRLAPAALGNLSGLIGAAVWGGGRD